MMNVLKTLSKTLFCIKRYSGKTNYRRCQQQLKSKMLTLIYGSGSQPGGGGRESVQDGIYSDDGIANIIMLFYNV